MDASSGAVEGAKRRYGFPVRQGIVGSDVWEGRHFDIVTMFHVLEHLVDPKRALEYARGLLKPGGRLLLQVPNAASIQARCFGAQRDDGQRSDGFHRIFPDIIPGREI